MSKQLTVERLKKLRFKRDLFLTFDKHHGNSAVNKEFNLVMSTKSRKGDYKIIERVVSAANGAECDMLADDLEAEIERFVEAYNAKKR